MTNDTKPFSLIEFDNGNVSHALDEKFQDAVGKLVEGEYQDPTSQDKRVRVKGVFMGKGPQHTLRIKTHPDGIVETIRQLHFRYLRGWNPEDTHHSLHSQFQEAQERIERQDSLIEEQDKCIHELKETLAGLEDTLAQTREVRDKFQKQVRVLEEQRDVFEKRWKEEDRKSVV